MVNTLCNAMLCYAGRARLCAGVVSAATAFCNSLRFFPLAKDVYCVMETGASTRMCLQRTNEPITSARPRTRLRSERASVRAHARMSNYYKHASIKVYGSLSGRAARDVCNGWLRNRTLGGSDSERQGESARDTIGTRQGTADAARKSSVGYSSKRFGCAPNASRPRQRRRRREDEDVASCQKCNFINYSLA